MAAAVNVATTTINVTAEMAATVATTENKDMAVMNTTIAALVAAATICGGNGEQGGYGDEGDRGDEGGGGGKRSGGSNLRWRR